MQLLDNPNASTAVREARAALLTDMWRTLTARQGWTRYDGAAGVEWGAQHTPTGAVIVPRAGETSRGRRWRDWLVIVPPTPHLFNPCDSLPEAVAFAETLPRLGVAGAVWTHHDGYGRPCWCDQPDAAPRG